MQIPGMHYQDEIWTVIKKALGESAMVAFALIGVEKLKNSDKWKAYAKPLEDALLITLEKHEKKLRRRVNRYDEDAYGLAQDLVAMLKEFPLKEQQGCPRYLARLAGQLTGIGAPVTEAKLRTVANNVFTELRDAVDVEGFKAACGEEITINRLFHLRLVDEQRQAMFKFLSAWRDDADLASMVVGEVLDPRLESLSVRRALKERSCPARWLMNWDEHYVHIQSVFYERHSTIPLDATRRAKLKRPLLSKSPKKFTYTKVSIDSLLKQLASYESVVSSLGGTGGDEPWTGDVGGHVVDDDPDQLRVNNAPENTDGESNDGASETDVEEEPRSLVDEVRGVTDGEFTQPDDDGAGPSPGKDTDEDHDEIEIEDEVEDEAQGELQGLGHESSVDSDEYDPEVAVENALTYRCLRQFPLTVQVGVLRNLALGAGDGQKDDLVETVQAMGVFEKFRWPVSIRSLSDARLASETRLPEHMESVSVKVFKEMVELAVKAFAQCARETLAQERKARNSNS